MARSFSRAPRARGAKKHTDWGASSALTVGIAVPAASAVLLEVFVPTGAGETLVRTRGMFGWATDNASGSESQLGAFGIGVVSEQASSVGITAVPHPGTDAGWGGWLYHSYWFSSSVQLSAVGLMPDMMHTIEIDSKAMRKVGENERIVIVVENTAASHGISFFHSVRLLSKAF